MNASVGRSMFLRSVAMAGFSTVLQQPVLAAPKRYLPLTRDVGYVLGDIEGALTCNTGAIAARDGLTIVDAAIPSGAAEALTALRAHTSLPLTRVIDTHYHLDHSYGNAFWKAHGAEPLALEGVEAELRASEPELFSNKPGLWQKMSRTLPTLATSHPLAPSYISSGTSFGVGATRMQILHFGVAHTRSDAVVWIPRERVLFAGDLVANGPYNAVADSTISHWIAVLDQLRALQPAIVVPGHGRAGGSELIDGQQAYFKQVTRFVDTLPRTDREVAPEIRKMRSALLGDARYAHFVNDHHMPYSGFFAFHDLVAKIVHERTGRTIARAPWMPPMAHCCGDLFRHAC